MRKIADVKNNHPEVKRVVIYKNEDGVYLFPCASTKDGSGIGDEWYQSVEEADAVCLVEYGINSNDWEIIDDPPEYCQHDWIAPVRIKGRNLGKPEWGKFEKLENGVWIEFSPTPLI
jgi:hypothetical protein